MKKDKKNYIFIIMIFLIIIAIVVSLVFVFSNDNIKDYENKLESAQKYVEDMDYKRAESLYLEAIKIDPNKKTAYLKLADVYIKDNKTEKAIEILEKGMKKISKKEKKALEEKLEQLVAKTVKLNLIYNNDNTQYGHIQGLNSQNKVVWEYKTQNHPLTEADTITEIGNYNDNYYFNDSGTIIVLKIKDGKVQWKNNDVGGMNAENAAIFDDEGKLYVSGFYGSDLTIIDRNGKTIKRVKSFNSKYYWPYQLELDGEKLYITYDGCEDDSVETPCKGTINLKDYSFSIDSNKTIPSKLSNEQIETVRKELKVPDNLEVTVEQGNSYYWSAGEVWVINVVFLHNGEYVAEATVNVETLEQVKNIRIYSE